MGKDPAFLFYPNDWLGGTLGMTFEEKGAYMELLMLQFNRGHMTKHMIGQTVGQLWDEIQDKFIQDDKGLWFNERLDLEKFKRKNYTESRRNNIKGNNQYSKGSGHTSSRMESKDEDVIKDIVKNNIKDRIENFDTKVWEINVFNSVLTKEECDKFVDYWTEHGEKDKKARWEKEKVFDIKKRMERWKRNNKSVNHGQSAIENHQNVIDDIDGSTLSQGDN